MKPITTRIIAAGAIGNVLEWYDFAIYGYFAPALGRAFFPAERPSIQLIAAFGIFAVGYLLRPLGGTLVGYLGDRLGRQAALTFSIAAMALPTFLVGVLPGYALLGIAAPIILTVLRMIQGLSVGGEYTTSIVFMVEHAPPARRGLIGAVAVGGAVAGILLGSATGAALAAAMSPDALSAWGWRIPFVVGMLVGLTGFLLRREVDEPPQLGKASHSPLIEAAQHHRPLLARLAGLSVFNATAFYLAFVYIVSWMQSFDGLTPARALEINTVSMVLLLVVMLVAGWMSDIVGRKPIMLVATGAACIGAVPLFWLMHHADSGLVLLGQFGFVVSTGLYLGAQPSFMTEIAPVGVRCTAIALGYNVTLGIVGGTSPMIAAWLVHLTHNPLSPALIIALGAAISFLTVWGYRETSKSSVELAYSAVRTS